MLDKLHFCYKSFSCFSWSFFRMKYYRWHFPFPRDLRNLNTAFHQLHPHSCCQIHRRYFWNRDLLRLLDLYWDLYFLFYYRLCFLFYLISWYSNFDFVHLSSDLFLYYLLNCNFSMYIHYHIYNRYKNYVLNLITFPEANYFIHLTEFHLCFS